MNQLGTPWADIVVRSAVVYVALLVGLRLIGKREMGQMTIFDLVMVLLIANAVQNAMVGPDTSLWGGLISAAVLLLMDKLVATLRLQRGVWGRLLEGTPTVLVQSGQFLDPALRKEGVEREQVLMAMREHGVADIEQVQLAVLETDGSVSIVPKETRMIRTRKRVRQMRHG